MAFSTRLATALIGAYLDLTLRTVRWRLVVDPSAQAVIDGDLQAVAVLWHEFLPFGPALWREAIRAGNPRRLHVMVSRHRDGQALARLFARWGLEVIAGSSDRVRADGGTRPKGGATALRRLLALRDQGAVLGLTPDGPRGPRRVPAAGAAMLAARTSLSLLPMAGATRPALRLRSWDRMHVPLPFARGVLVYGPLFDIGADRHAGSDEIVRAALDGVARIAAEALGRVDD